MNKNNISRTTLIISVLVLMILFLIKIFTWSLVDTLTVFIFPLLLMFILWLTVVYIIFLLYKFIRSLKNGFNIRNISLGIVIILLISMYFIPVDAYSERIRFSTNYKQFNSVAALMIEKDIEGTNILLPKEYQHLSRGGGEINIVGENDERIVMFYSFRGVLDNFTMYVYVPNERAYKNLEKYEDWKDIEKINDKWYVCVSY